MSCTIRLVDLLAVMLHEVPGTDKPRFALQERAMPPSRRVKEVACRGLLGIESEASFRRHHHSHLTSPFRTFGEGQARDRSGGGASAFCTCVR